MFLNQGSAIGRPWKDKTGPRKVYNFNACRLSHKHWFFSIYPSLVKTILFYHYWCLCRRRIVKKIFWTSKCFLTTILNSQKLTANTQCLTNRILMKSMEKYNFSNFDCASSRDGSTYKNHVITYTISYLRKKLLFYCVTKVTMPFLYSILCSYS